MDYKNNLIEAYAKLDKVVEIHLEKGGAVDDRTQLQAELQWRLNALDAPPTSSMVGDVKIWSNGMWYAPSYHAVCDNRGYVHVVHTTTAMATDNYYGALHHWMRDAFLKPETATPRICGLKRDTIHHINENKRDNNAANLLYIPKSLHRIYHPSTTSMAASDVALEFVARYGDKALTVAAPNIVDARWLHGILGLSKRFTDWIEQWREGVEFTPHLQVKREIGQFKGCAGQNRQDYTLSVRDALKIAMKTDTANAADVRDDLLDKLESAQKLATVIKSPLTTETLRKDYPDLMTALNRAFKEQSAENKALQAQLSAWQDLVGDGGYVSKRAVRRLKKELVGA